MLEDLLICVHINDVRFSDAFIREHMEKPIGIERAADSPKAEPEAAKAEAAEPEAAKAESD